MATNNDANTPHPDPSPIPVEKAKAQRAEQDQRIANEISETAETIGVARKLLVLSKCPLVQPIALVHSPGIHLHQAVHHLVVLKNP